MADTTAETADTEGTAGAAAKKQERKAAKLAKQIGAFGKEHGGVEGHLAHIGQAGTRIVLVGTDGAWGDLVAPQYATAVLAAEKAGLTLHDEFDGEFAAKVRTGPYEWNRMAGIQLGGTQDKAA
ncbi:MULTISPECIES: hypothetical protein [unclassified Streptomyces]|uniref:hypothetical protein n=1 Tax=unclassified Streptomyces TaxID=2593676 RepID=UPI0022553884|nr:MULTISPECIES: hypothetical protein [unclassified Streptomyces]MCX4525229.1 hypothetical protein [Streptomyces sp. NBC_01551]MCX4544259.1 hypothetical protein [Streptomyces sp. NBC_01565]